MCYLFSDVDECLSKPCASGMTCLNVYGSYYCITENDSAAPGKRARILRLIILVSYYILG